MLRQCPVEQELLNTKLYQILIVFVFCVHGIHPLWFWSRVGKDTGRLISTQYYYALVEESPF